MAKTKNTNKPAPSRVNSNSRAERIAEVLAIVHDRVDSSQRDAVSAFVPKYFEHVDPNDLLAMEPADLYGAALSHWQFAGERKAGKAKVRVYNPSLQDHGWHSASTIVEIVNDDMPFLVDSVTMEVNRQSYVLHLIIHPLISMKRSGGQVEESMMHLQIDRIADPARLKELAEGLEHVLADVRAAVKDWLSIKEQLQLSLDEIEAKPPPLPAQELTEGKAFLAWLLDNNFVLLGHRRHNLVTEDGEDSLQIIPGSTLGILASKGQQKAASSFAALPVEMRAYVRRPQIVVVTKSTSRSTVHRPGYLDSISVKRFDDSGAVVGEHRFLGLFTSIAYSTKPADIPLLRTKTESVLKRAGLKPGSHGAKALVNILDTYPRDELFQIEENELLDTAIGILHLGDRQRLRLFVRRDPFERFVSCLIFAPRENYTTDLRIRWQQILVKALNGTSAEFNVSLTESPVARVLITVRTQPGTINDYDVADLDAKLTNAARRWEDDLKAALIASVGESAGSNAWRHYANAFPVGYKDDTPARLAVADIEHLMALSADEPMSVRLYRPLEAAVGMLRFKLFHYGAPVTLSHGMPFLERLGITVLDERPYEIQTEAGEAAIWLHEFGLKLPDEVASTDPDTLHKLFEEAFIGLFRGEIENDDFNRLVILAGVPAEHVVVLRAYAKYMRQIGFSLSQSFIENTLAGHGTVACQLIDLFCLRFDPSKTNITDEQIEHRREAIEASLEDVDNLSEDRVMRQYLTLIMATLRTNFWRQNNEGQRRSFLSFKFDPSQIPGLPEPRPHYEVFVYSPRFEGVHMRGGKVARGGLRWSDRLEDFRTEVLGLVKAQIVKNTVIVPVGSKGGFVLKRPPTGGDREALLAEGIACYKDFLRGMLDLTDNRVGDEVVTPPDVRGPELNDPYLVVAADKGTATFSDYANEVSAEYGFWLGDAFASGGSVGYDHKVMGITARGAWESVKRHFRELGTDTQSAEFSAAGVGDMSGDVFGNGMLLSPHTRLIAAFDHRHVFIDPAPDAALAHAERARLFKLPRSSWGDYDTSLISEGGGVFSRAAKSVKLSDAAREALGIETNKLTPTELVTAVLKAPVDLLFNGGIGTYVKASTESHNEVGDRANDPVRVNGKDLRCKVVGEGGNLGLTQLGRIEFALNGGAIYTDAIDNSAGVGTSDREVNIKILLELAIREGELTVKQRDQILASMTDEVADLVLRDNYFQSQVISLTGRIATNLLAAQSRFMVFLEKAGRLQRSLEFMPDEETLRERRAAGLGLTSPERAVLLAYAKIWLNDGLVASALPDDPWVATALQRYFPRDLQERFGDWMLVHPLRREIIATHVTNSTLNRVGATFVHRTCETTGAEPDEVVRAYLLAREVFGLIDIWADIEELDNQVPDASQVELLLTVGKLVDRATIWFLRSARLNHSIADTISEFAPQIASLEGLLNELLDSADVERLQADIERIAGEGVPTRLARRVVSLEPLFAGLDIREVTSTCDAPIQDVARIYFGLARKLNLGWLREQIVSLPGNLHWQMLARGAMMDDLAELQRTLTVQVLQQGEADTTLEDRITQWEEHQQRPLDRSGRLIAELRGGGTVDEAMLSVAIRELRHLG